MTPCGAKGVEVTPRRSRSFPLVRYPLKYVIYPCHPECNNSTAQIRQLRRRSGHPELDLPYRGRLE